MAAGEAYFNCDNKELSANELLRNLTSLDDNGNPYLNNNFVFGGGFPPPPYAVIANNFGPISSVNDLTYEEYLGPSNESIPLKIVSINALPNIGTFILTPSANLEFKYNAIWFSTPLLIPRTNGTFDSGLILKVRLKVGLSQGNYNETLTLTGTTNTSPYILNVTGSVSPNLNYTQASGGIITYDGDYKIHTFPYLTAPQFLNITNAVTGVLASHLLIAGGGGGGWFAGGGGGAGGALENNIYQPVIGNWPVIIGAGGAGSNSTKGGAGQDSTFCGIIAFGGGGGGGEIGGSAHAGNGGSGGGGSYDNSDPGGTGVPGQGHNGAMSGGSSGAGSGGGGANTAGSQSAINAAGNGGDGFSSSISGTTKTYCGGGGGGAPASGGLGLGGFGGGGNGENTSSAQNGSRPGAGGGGSYVGQSGNGADGEFTFRYKYKN